VGCGGTRSGRPAGSAAAAAGPGGWRELCRQEGRRRPTGMSFRPPFAGARSRGRAAGALRRASGEWPRSHSLTEPLQSPVENTWGFGAVGSATSLSPLGMREGARPRPRGIAGISQAVPECAREVSATADWLAERVGFEPTVPFGTHAFQACAFSRSAISPRSTTGVSWFANRRRERTPERSWRRGRDSNPR
jgi:hypothetical protein